MLYGKDLSGNPIVSVSNGEIIGHVKDLYTDKEMNAITGLYLGVKGLLDRTPLTIDQADIVTVGPDAVLVNSPTALREGQQYIAEDWVRRDEIQGRNITTTGSTPVGIIDDLMFDQQGRIKGFSLSYVYVEGPVREKRAIDREAVADLGHKSGTMTCYLAAVEHQELAAV